jgi:hypothetical protein
LAELRALQERFFALVTAREDVAGALLRLELEPAAAEAMVRSDARLDAVGRIGIYNDMYFMRLRGVLGQDFSALLALLGEDDFRVLLADYLEVFPPRDPCLRDFARALPGFLAAHRDDYPLFAGRPWIADLAALEWARADLFDRPDAPVLTTAHLQALSPEAFATLPLQFVPACTIVDVDYAVDELWRALEGEENDGHGKDDDGLPKAVAAPAAGPVRLLVWREGLDIYHRRAGADEAPRLPSLREGTTFGALCEQLGEGRSVEQAAELAFGLLATWIHGGVLQAPAAPP